MSVGSYWIYWLVSRGKVEVFIFVTRQRDVL